MTDVSLTVNNQLYSGWLAVTITQSIENLSGTFQLVLTNKWSSDSEPVVIKSSDSCVLTIDDFVIITGYVDRVYLAIDANSHTITINGRDKTADLIDCSIIDGTGQYKNLTLTQIAENICKPFGIKVITKAPIGEIFKSFNIEQGASAYETLLKLCKARGVLAMSDGAGNLLITQAGNIDNATPLVEGINILSASGEYDYSYRYNKYICKGQLQGYDGLDIDSTVMNKAEIVDDSIKRYRPLVVIADGQATKANCEIRAKWEMSNRRGRSRRLTVRVNEWLQPITRTPWIINQLVNVESKSLEVFDKLLIVGLTFNKDEGGEITTLELTSPDAYLLSPLESLDITQNAFINTDNE